ncbi:hypothetical protein, partial [Klebsiella pneumoniae]|uniref:hypothetical protein n=1 Tax=Klebsiella pneumoniae TaxID=573 RepID=UPI00301355B7
TFWAEGATPQDGERVVTSAEAGAFPANLPIGTVHYSVANVPEVVPLAMLAGFAATYLMYWIALASALPVMSATRRS